MSDPNLTDKFVENINNALKKTKIFEKMETTYFCINSFIVISSIIGLTSIYINYYNLDKIKHLEEKIKDNIEINQKQNQTVMLRLLWCLVRLKKKWQKWAVLVSLLIR